MRALNVLLSILVSLLIAALVFEGGLRLIGMGPPATLNRFDPKVGWVKKPDIEVVKTFDEIPTVTFHTNSLGLRDDPMPSPAKPAGTYRILMLGDSFTLGYTVGREDLFVDLLERRYLAEGRPVDVVNAGTEGYSTDQEVAWYMAYGKDYDADLVVLLPYDNDVFWCGEERYTAFRKPRFVADGRLESTDDLPNETNGLGRTTAIGRLLTPRSTVPMMETSGGRRVPTEFGVLLHDPPPNVEEAKERFGGALQGMIEACETTGAKLVIAPIPSHASVDDEFRTRFGKEFLGVQPEEWDPNLVIDSLLAAARRGRIDAVDARPDMRAAHWDQPCYHDYFDADHEWHLNAAGNHAFASFLYDALEPYVPPKEREASEEDLAAFAPTGGGDDSDGSGGPPFFVVLYLGLWAALTALYYGHYQDEAFWLPPLKVGLILVFVFSIFMGVDAGVSWLALHYPGWSGWVLGVLVALVLGFVAYKMGNRLATMAELLWAFMLRGHWYLMPMVVVLLTIGSLLVVAASSPLVAPFIYTLF